MPAASPEDIFSESFDALRALYVDGGFVAPYPNEVGPHKVIKCRSFLPEDDPDFISDADTSSAAVANRRKKGLVEHAKEDSSYVSPIGVMLDSCKYAAKAHLLCF